MATIPSKPSVRPVEYPSSDGKPVAETPTHRDILLGLVETLKQHFAPDPMVYVSGNMFVYYVEGDTRKNVAPDVWMARGVPNKDRDVYLVWDEPSGPQMVIEVSSKKTKRQDLREKFELYRDVLKVYEYFLFDPRGEYLDPPLRGYRLVEGAYVSIGPVHGRLPSVVAGLHLERDGQVLRLFDPATGRWLPWTWELRQDLENARGQLQEVERRAEAAQRQLQDVERRAEAMERAQAEEVERFRKELEALRHRRPGES